MIKYIFGSICIIFLTLYLYVKVKYKFWSIQPVFHIHNLKYWIWPPGIIQHGLPPKTKYYNWRIEFDTFEKTSTEKKELFYFLIKTQYLNNIKAKYNPPRTGVLEYFKCHSTPTYLSLYFDYYPTPRDNKTEYNKKLIACMTSRRLTGHIYNKKLIVAYVDFLCIHSTKRKQGYAAKQIYTHYYNHRRKNKNPIMMFKREGTVNFMTPITTYYAYAFSTKIWNKPNFQLPNNISCHLVTTQNFEILVHYIKEVKSHFSLFVIPDLSHLKNLVQHSLIIPCVLMDKDNVCGVYFYRRPYTLYDGEDSIECLGSYCSNGYEDIFLNSFQNTIVLIQKKYTFSIIIIENISYNTKLIKTVLDRDVPKWKCPMAYYFYNFAYKPFYSPNVLIIN